MLDGEFVVLAIVPAIHVAALYFPALLNRRIKSADECVTLVAEPTLAASLQDLLHYRRRHLMRIELRFSGRCHVRDVLPQLLVYQRDHHRLRSMFFHLSVPGTQQRDSVLQIRVRWFL